MNVTIIGPWVVVVLEEDKTYKIGAHRLGVTTEENIKNSIAAAIIKAHESSPINMRTEIRDRPSLFHCRSLDEEYFYQKAYDLMVNDAEYRREFWINKKKEIEERDKPESNEEVQK